MRLKAKDDITPLVAQLDGLLACHLTDAQRSAVEKERATLLAGAKAEEEAAYLIAFCRFNRQKFAGKILCRPCQRG